MCRFDWLDCEDLGSAQPSSSSKSRTANQQQLDTHDHQKRKLPSQQQTAEFLSATRIDAPASACFWGFEVFSTESPALDLDRVSTALAHGVANFVTPLRMLSRCVGELSTAGKAWDARVGWVQGTSAPHPPACRTSAFVATWLLYKTFRLTATCISLLPLLLSSVWLLAHDWPLSVTSFLHCAP
jgi:hypothetical protein